MSIQAAPDYGLHRKKLVTADTGTITNKKRGINCGSYRFANIQVVPYTGTPNPTVEVLFWSEKASKFIHANTALSKTGIGAGVPYEFTVECNGRLMFVFVTGTLTGGVDVYVSGYGMDHTL